MKFRKFINERRLAAPKKRTSWSEFPPEYFPSELMKKYLKMKEKFGFKILGIVNGKIKVEDEKGKVFLWTKEQLTKAMKLEK